MGTRVGGLSLYAAEDAMIEEAVSFIRIKSTLRQVLLAANDDGLLGAFKESFGKILSCHAASNRSRFDLDRSSRIRREAGEN